MTQPTIADLADIEAIRRTIVQYAHLLDDGRFAEWGALFTPDAQFWSIPGRHLPGGHEIARIEGRDAIIASVAEVRRNLGERGAVLHFGGMPLIDLMGEEARAWWDFLIVQGGAILFAGRYHARLVREDDRWRFTRRISLRSGYPMPAELTTASAD